MTSLGQLVKDTAKSAVCSLLASDVRLNDALQRSGVPVPNPEIPKAARGALCSNPSPGPLPQPPYNGGQCRDVAYRIQGTHNARAVNNQQPISGNFSVGRIGPITSVTGETATVNGFKTSYVLVTHKGGTDRVDSLGGCEFISVTGITVTRVDGQPDTCGNLPTPEAPVPTTGIPYTGPQGVYTNEGGQQVTVTPTGNVKAPIRLPSGDISVNVQVNVGGVVFDTDVNLNTGNVNINLGGGNGNRPRGDEASDGDNTKTDNEPPNTGTPGERLPTDRPPEGERRIIGVIVSSTSVNETNGTSRIFQNDNPTIYAPSLGHVNFLCRIGTGRTGAWTEDIKVKNRRHLIPCPWPQGAVDVKGTPQPGVSFTLTPVYDEVQSQVQK